VWQMHRALGGDKQRRSSTMGGVIGPCFVNLRPSVCIAQGALRRDGGYIKPTCYVCRLASRAPKGVADASGL
jgi:hypothetical protein